MQPATALRTRTAHLAQIAFWGEPQTPFMEWFAAGLDGELRGHGHEQAPDADDAGLIINVVDPRRPRPFRRKSQGTFVVSVTEVDGHADQVLRAAYPYLVRSLANLLIYITHADGETRTHFVTMEQGYYTVQTSITDEKAYFAELYDRLAPLASSRLVINNIFEPDLEPELWEGDEITEALYDAGRKLDEMKLLPAPFPIDELLGQRDLAHVKRLYGIGGLSYGNLSARKDETRFWMSASGVDKSNLREIGRDILLIKGYDAEENSIRVSVPPHVEPRRASVDAIEHWMLYTEHPEIGAIVHIHAWMEGIASTNVNYPCGTYELAQEVAELVRAEPDPNRAVIGLKNHGLTITGRNLAEIFDRLEGRILPQVPME